MGTKASVLSVNKDGTLQLQAGILKISARQSEVRVVEGETQSQKEARKIIQRAERTLRTAAPREVDLRGMMTDEAVAALESFLDTAMLGKLETVTIIHGKGTGAVRNAVRTYLKRSRYVKAFRPGRYGEGGRRRDGGGIEITFRISKPLVPSESGGGSGELVPPEGAARECASGPRRDRPRL